MKLHIKIKRYRNNPDVYCGRSIGYFDKVEKHEVYNLIKFHGTKKHFCQHCLRMLRNEGVVVK